MIGALALRLNKVKTTALDLERVGAFHNRIIKRCTENPPKDSRHLRALQEQVRSRGVHDAASQDSPQYGARPQSRYALEIVLLTRRGDTASLCPFSHTWRTKNAAREECNFHQQIVITNN